MEPERKIEKLLRAYAKKRRADAGDAFKLHPATRRLLQAEVARNQPKPDEDEADVSLWELFRRQWAFLAVFALMVFFGAALFLPALGKAKFKSQQTAAVSNLKQIGVAAQMAAGENNGRLPVSLDALTNQLGSEKILTDAESGKRFVYVAGGETLDALPSNALLAYSPTDKKGRAVLFADGRVEVIKGDAFSALTNQGLSPLIAANNSFRRQLGEAPATLSAASGSAASAPALSEQLKSEANREESKLADLGVAAPGTSELAANKPAAPPAAFDRLAKEQDAAGKDFAAQPGGVQFTSAASQPLAQSQQNSFKNLIAATKAAPVLMNFQVQQNGNAIRVVDGDGSVYDGSLLPGSEVAQTTPAPAAPAEVIPAAARQNEKAKTITSREDSQAAQNASFRVSGMNQTLKQHVVFTGNLLAISNPAMNAQKSFGSVTGMAGGSGGGGGGGQTQSGLAQQSLWSNSRIAGTAVVANTNQIEINAVPLAP